MGSPFSSFPPFGAIMPVLGHERSKSYFEIVGSPPPLEFYGTEIRNINKRETLLQYYKTQLHQVEDYYFEVLPPSADYNPIEDARYLWDHKTRLTCTGQACRASTFSTQTAWRVFILPDLQL
jgi:hypothetical protein